jgi:hypothetical protein
VDEGTNGAENGRDFSTVDPIRDFRDIVHIRNLNMATEGWQADDESDDKEPTAYSWNVPCIAEP